MNARRMLSFSATSLLLVVAAVRPWGQWGWLDAGASARDRDEPGGVLLCIEPALGNGPDCGEARDEPYNFRASDAYAALSDEDRAMLEQVHHDLTLLWGALDRFAEDHGGEAPRKLEALVPIYLQELPADPFAQRRARDAEARGDDPLSRFRESLRYRRLGFEVSLDGLGYLYCPGAGRSWIIASSGLGNFPYRGNAERGVTLSRGSWDGAFQVLYEKPLP